MIWTAQPDGPAVVVQLEPRRPFLSRESILRSPQFFGDSCRQIVDATVEVVGGAEEDDRAGNVLQIHAVGDGRRVERVVGRAITDAAAGRRGGFDPIIGSGCHHREFAAHRVSVGSESFWIDLWLLFQKRKSTTGAECAEEPRVVARRIDGIERPCGW